MRKLVWTALLTPMLALAAPPPSAPPGQGSDDSARRERVEKRLRTMRVVGIAEALDLSTAEALKLAEAMRPFDERRRSLRKQIHESAQVIKHAAEEGASATAGQVDAAVQRILDARVQLASLDKDMFNALSRDLNPQQKAKLAMFFAHFEREMRGRTHGEFCRLKEEKPESGEDVLPKAVSRQPG